MRLVDKRTLKPVGDPLSADQMTALNSLELGVADTNQDALAQRVIEHARNRGFWLECDCRESSKQPLLAGVVYGSGTVGWRSLLGEGRPSHSDTCVYSRRNRDAMAYWATPQTTPVDGFCAILKPSGDNKPGVAPGYQRAGSVTRRKSIPRVTRVLRSLLVEAGLNSCVPYSERYDQDENVNPTTVSYRKLKQASAKFEISKGFSLKDYLHTFAPSYGTPYFFKELRQKFNEWPKGSMAQSFFCFQAERIEKRTVFLAKLPGKPQKVIDLDFDPVAPKIHGTIVQGPYLFFGVTGKDAQTGMIDIQRAVLEPVVSRKEFVPVDSDLEREAWATLKFTLERASSEYPDYTWSLTKPLFDILTPEGACLPDMVIEATGGERTYCFVIECMGLDRPDYFASKDVTHSRMRHIGDLIEMDGGELKSDRTIAGRKVTETLLDLMER